MNLLILNGPNLNLTGKRQPEWYGTKSFEDFYMDLVNQYRASVALHYFQSNVEGELINKLHESLGTMDGVILNAGGYTHTSVALADAVAAIDIPVVEVHLSHIFARESFRHISFISKHARGLISGFGLQSYRLAIEYFLQNKPA